jgi:hypothetical protein
VLRLRQLALVAEQLAPVVDGLGDVFGLAVAFRDPGVATFGLENAVLPVGSQFIEVVAPTREGTAGGRYLERRGGDGGYMVILQCDDHAPRKARVDELGVRKVVEHDEPGYRIMQLHPQDTRGSFLEVDVQIGGEELDGPWVPAGPAWQQARRTERVAGIAAAEIQSPEPDAVAARWSELLDVAVEADADGHPTLALDNATIRFVDATDGRGEGLGGIDLVAVDPAAVLAAADERGARLDDDTEAVLLGGVRFRLVDG